MNGNIFKKISPAFFYWKIYFARIYLTSESKIAKNAVKFIKSLS